MASLFKSKTVTYCDAAGKRCDKDAPGAGPVTLTSKKWYGRYKDADGKLKTVVLSKDKQTSRAQLAELEKRSEQRRSGLIDPKAERFRDHDARPLADHLADFEAYLRSKGGSAKHPVVTKNRAAKILDLAKFARISDIQLSATMIALASLRADLGRETINHHVRAVKGFARWLWKEGRAREHHLAHLATSSSESDRKRERRALTPEEAGRLIDAAQKGGKKGNMAGPDRAMLYAVALGTGFRASELGSLTPTSFALDDSPPTVTVRAAYAKNGKQAAQPIAGELAAALIPWVAEKPPREPVFPMPTRTAEMFRVDLAAAGIAVTDPVGHILDFHALRHSYISWVVGGRVSVKVAQTLARHSTPSLTIGIYARATAADVADAVANLPGFPRPKRDPSGR